jgi:L-prolyl-PCP dehydrogenase
MDFSWTEEQMKLREAITKFAQKELNNDLLERDKKSEFNLDGWKKCGEFGIHGLPIPSKYGGNQADPITTIGALEALGYGCKDNGLIFSVNAHMWGCEIPILFFGTAAQKEKYLPKLCRGEFIGGLAMSEPGSGSDAYNLRTMAQRQGEKYLLNGRKTFITNGPIADVLIVFATMDREKGARGITGFLVEKDCPGLSIRPNVEKMGIRTAPMGEVILDNWGRRI